MGKTKIGYSVKLIAGFIFSSEKELGRAKGFLEKKFGKIDYESRILPFIHTTYYEKEFGKNLKRAFVSFKKLIPPQELPKIKITTNKIETELAVGASRLVNIDPGYLNLSKLILASTKDYRHRIYLDKGIYAEAALFYRNKTFQPWEWTYPDYATPEYIEIFNKIRDIYAGQTRRE